MGVLEFCRRTPKFTALVIVAPGNQGVARRHGLHAVSWEEFIVSGRRLPPDELSPLATRDRFLTCA